MGYAERRASQRRSARKAIEMIDAAGIDRAPMHTIVAWAQATI
jgi:hypothetical protein